MTTKTSSLSSALGAIAARNPVPASSVRTFAPVMNTPATVAADLPYRSPYGRLVYQVDAWSREQFDSQVQVGGALSGVVKAVSGQHQLLHREVFGRLYGLGVSRLEDAEIDPGVASWAPALHQQASELPEWRGMEAAADGDPMLCGIATATVGAVLNLELPKDLPINEGELKASRDAVDAMLPELTGRARKRFKRMREQMDVKLGEAAAHRRQYQEKLEKNMPRLRSRLRDACEAATEAIEEMKAAGTMAGHLAGRGTSTPTKLARSKALNHPKVRRVLALAGRMRHEVASKRKLGGSGREEIHSVELGADIDRLLPVEVALLGAPMGAELLVGKLADRRALQYAMRGRSKKTKGPILIAIDESGSMNGARDEWAKAVALSLMWIAQAEGRPFGVLHFSTTVGRVDLFGAGRATEDLLMNVVSHFENGGTDIENAMRKALGFIKSGTMPDPMGGPSVTWNESQKADLVIISDGADSSDVVGACDAFDAAGVGVYGIAIESDFARAFRDRMQHAVHLSEEEVRAGLVPTVLLKV